MSYYPKPDDSIRNKVKVVLDLSSYTTKKELDHAGCVDTSDLAAKNNFIALKAKVNKLDINELINFVTSLNNLKTKIDDLDVAKLKTAPTDLKKLSDAVKNRAMRETKFNTLKTKVNKLDKKISYATTLIHINQCNTDKESLENKIGDVDQKLPDTSGLVTTTLLNTNIEESANKIPDHAKYITTEVFNKLTAEDFAGRLKQVYLVRKNGVNNKLISFSWKIISNKTKYLELLKKLDSLTTKDYNFLLGRMYFTSDDGHQNTYIRFKKWQRYWLCF